MNEKKLMEYANSTFDEAGISIENLFRSLLLKRRAFIHESEVRLLYDEWDESALENSLYSYSINPHELISQIMIDPRRSYAEFKRIKTTIRSLTGYRGEIKRSLLYALPKDLVLDVTNDQFD